MNTNRLTSLIPLLVAIASAAVAMVGGAQLARRNIVTRIPPDRVRIREFTDLFQDELTRLSELYQDHLSRVARQMAENPSQTPENRELCASLIGLRACRIFYSSTAAAAFSLTPPSGGKPRVPDIEFEKNNDGLTNSPAILLPKSLWKNEEPRGWVPLRKGEWRLFWEKSGPDRRKPRVPDAEFEKNNDGLTDSQAILLPKSLWKNEKPRGWLPLRKGEWRLFWEKIGPDRLVVLLVESESVRSAIQSSLSSWLETAFAPLQQAGEYVLVKGGQTVLAGADAPPEAPLAVTIPLRTPYGSWEIAAWDQVKTHTEYDSLTLTVASLVAGLVILLFLRYQRAIHRAEERVSFVNRVSHELSTPLTNILLTLSLAEDSLQTRPEKAQSRLKLATEEVQRLVRLVANVLAFSRRGRSNSSTPPSPCFPEEILAQVLSQFDGSLKRHAIQLEWQNQPTSRVMLDADALAQIVGNLLSNVEKYAATCGWARIESRMENGELIVRVIDGGPGIPMKDQQRIFEPFERVDSRSNEGASGTGLGLTISRELAEKMGGTLKLLPQASETAFELRVPAPLAPDQLAEGGAP